MLQPWYGWGSVQPQSTIVESWASARVIPKQMHWYHSKQVRRCTISLRVEHWVFSPCQNTHKEASNAPHFQGRRGHMWLKLLPCPGSGSQIIWKGSTNSFSWEQQEGEPSFSLYHTAPSSLQCCCIGFFKEQAAKATCNSSKITLRCQN